MALPTPATFGQSVLTAQLDFIQNTSTRLALCKNYLRSDDYSTVEGKIVAETAILSSDPVWGSRVSEETSPGDIDAPNMQQHLTAIELDPATALGANGSSDALSLILMSATEVLAVTDETSDRAVSEFDVITTFAYYIQSTQPSSV